jgi:hypothetical protein
MMQGVEKGRGRNLRSFPFSTFPQPIFQRVDSSVERFGGDLTSFEKAAALRRLRARRH